MPQSYVPTLKDVAREARVHPGTASRALRDDQAYLTSEATRARVRQVADRLGYRTNALAQSLRKGTTGAWGIVVADLANPFIISVLRGIEDECRSKEILPLIAESHDDPAMLRRVVGRLLRNRVDALILSGVHISDQAYVTELEQELPVVLAVRGFPQPSDRPEPIHKHLEVLHDDFAGARTATAHLILLGHRRIAQLPGPPHIASFISRSRGFQAAVADAPGVEVSAVMHASASTTAEGRRLVTELLQRPVSKRPTAIFAHNDLMAVGAMEAVKAAGLRCPDDISIVGYNDAPLSDHLDPPLTTVRLPGTELGRRSARMVFDTLAGNLQEQSRIVLPPQFVERASTRPPQTSKPTE